MFGGTGGLASTSTRTRVGTATGDTTSGTMVGATIMVLMVFVTTNLGSCVVRLMRIIAKTRDPAVPVMGVIVVDAIVGIMPVVTVPVAIAGIANAVVMTVLTGATNGVKFAPDVVIFAADVVISAADVVIFAANVVIAPVAFVAIVVVVVIAIVEDRTLLRVGSPGH